MLPFQPNCSHPPEHSNFVSSPNIRGTLDILWGCLSIVFLCTWSVLRLNVPIQITSQTTPQQFLAKCFMIWRKFKWTIAALLAPEVILGFALSSFTSARHNLRQMAEFVNEDSVPWTVRHSYCANMGGFAITFDHLLEISEQAPEKMTLEKGIPEIKILSHPTVSTRNNSQLPEQISQRTAPKKDNSQVTVALQHDNPIALERGYSSIPSDDNITHTFSSLQLQGTLVPGLRNGAEETEVFRILDKKYSLLALAQRRSTAPFKSGETDWHQDNNNLSLVIKALTEISKTPQFDLRTYLSMSNLQGNVWHLNADQLSYARKAGIINRLPDVSTSALRDKDKGDSLVVILALLQILWLALQLLFRELNGLTSTQLELVTLSYAACGIVTYALNFKMPRDINVPIYLRAARYGTSEEISAISQLHPEGVFNLVEARASSFSFLWLSDPRIRFPSATISRKSWLSFYVGSTFGAILLGGLHTLAWNSTFPTNIEQYLWHMASLLTVAIPVSVVITVVLTAYFNITDPRVPLFIFFLPTYILVRLFCIVEAIRSLGFQPPSAFISTWATGIPHLG